jgi:hypothetical protein
MNQKSKTANSRCSNKSAYTSWLHIGINKIHLIFKEIMPLTKSLYFTASIWFLETILDEMAWILNWLISEWCLWVHYVQSKPSNMLQRGEKELENKPKNQKKKLFGRTRISLQKMNRASSVNRSTTCGWSAKILYGTSSEWEKISWFIVIYID